MPRTANAIYATTLKYATLGPSHFPDASRPPLYFDYVPVKDAAGAEIRPPFAILRDNGQTPTIAGFERTTLEVCRFDIEIFYINDLEKVSQAVWAVRLNGGGIGDGLGFDYGDLPAIGIPRADYQLVRTKVRFNFDSFDRDSKPVYRGVVSYKVTVKEVP